MDSIPDKLLTGFYDLASCYGDCVCLGFGDESVLDPAHSLLFVPDKICDCDRSRQPGAECLGFVTRPCWVMSRRYCTLHNSICNRHGKCRPTFTGNFEPFNGLLPGLRHELRGLFDLFIDHYREEWINKWPLKKRDLIRFDQQTRFVSPGLVKLFAKYEGGHSRPTKGRGIQMYYDLATQSLFAPEFTALQKAFAVIFDGSRSLNGIDITFASGMTHAQLGSWMDDTLARGDCLFYERDGKNWDATMSRPHHDMKNFWYRSIVGDDFADFVDSCYEVKGSARTPNGLFKYKLSGTTKSGHNDTTLGNSLINAAITYSAMAKLGLRGRIMVAGDDCLVAIYGGGDVYRLSTVESEFGIVPEARVFDHWSEVSFISGVWYPTPNGFTFGPKLGRLLARLFWTTKMVPKRKRSAWRHSVAMGLLGFFGEVPILRAWLSRNRCIGAPVIEVEKLNVEYAVIKGGLLGEYISQRYNISMADICEVEAFIMSLPPRPGYVSHPVLDAIMEVDLADIFDRPVGRVHL